MTIEQQILSSIEKAENYSISLADQIIYDQSIGDKSCCEIKLLLVGQWIWILKDYLIYNFDEDTGSTITPDYTCVDLNSIQKLMGKINNLSC